MLKGKEKVTLLNKSRPEGFWIIQVCVVSVFTCVPLEGVSILLKVRRFKHFIAYSFSPHLFPS